MNDGNMVRTKWSLKSSHDRAQFGLQAIQKNISIEELVKRGNNRLMSIETSNAAMRAVCCCEWEAGGLWGVDCAGRAEVDAK